MKKVGKILLQIILLPITILLLPVRLIMSCIIKNKTSQILNSMTVQNVDTMSGADFEMLVCVLFDNMGFKAERTQASRDYGADVIAKKGGKKYVIQTKLYYNRTVGNACINEVYTALDYYHGNVAIAMTNAYFSKPAKNVANELHVALIDRDALIKLIGCPRAHRYKLFLSLISPSQG